MEATVTYHAPPGDNKVVETRGLTFYHDQAQQLDTDEHADFLAKAQGNPHFEVSMPEEAKRRGRPPKSLKADIDEAATHDFEKDRRDRLEREQDERED
jgi:hypothetical protein